MKKSAFQYNAYGTNGNLGIEIMLDLGRELNDTDNTNLRECVEMLATKLNEETLRLNPKTKEMYDETSAKLVGLFGERRIFVTEIPNEYCNCYHCKLTSPWFLVVTGKGAIKIGWRKRVINIDWSASEVTKKADELFPDENVTKDFKSIHAWGYDKAKEYIDKILA